MVDVLAASLRLVDAYNKKHLDDLEAMLAPDLDFAHYNRSITLDRAAALMDIIRHFASTLAPDRQLGPTSRHFINGNTIVRETYWHGTAAQDVPGFASAGEKFRFDLISLLRFNEDGIVEEWKDYG